MEEKYNGEERRQAVCIAIYSNNSAAYLYTDGNGQEWISEVR